MADLLLLSQKVKFFFFFQHVGLHHSVVLSKIVDYSCYCNGMLACMCMYYRVIVDIWSMG